MDKIKCANCDKEILLNEAKTCMDNNRHYYVCSLNCMKEFYVPKNPPMNKDVCKWLLQDDESELWKTTCGHKWYFADLPLSDSGFVYCPGCGKTIEEVKEDEEN